MVGLGKFWAMGHHFFQGQQETPGRHVPTCFSRPGVRKKAPDRPLPAAFSVLSAGGGTGQLRDGLRAPVGQGRLFFGIMFPSFLVYFSFLVFSPFFPPLVFLSFLPLVFSVFFALLFLVGKEGFNSPYQSANFAMDSKTFYQERIHLYHGVCVFYPRIDEL